jgi:uncharacterized protein YnzC (UPF0291/DUF896 family)
LNQFEEICQIENINQKLHLENRDDNSHAINISINSKLSESNYKRTSSNDNIINKSNILMKRTNEGIFEEEKMNKSQFEKEYMEKSWKEEKHQAYKKENIDEVKIILQESMDFVNKKFNLAVPIKIDIAVGKNYGDTH